MKGIARHNKEQIQLMAKRNKKSHSYQNVLQEQKMNIPLKKRRINTTK